MGPFNTRGTKTINSYFFGLGLWVWGSILGLLHSTLVPGLYSCVTTNATNGVGLVLVLITTIQTTPGRLTLFFGSFSFTIVSTGLTVVTLYIRLNVRSVVMGVLRGKWGDKGIVLRIQCFGVTSNATKEGLLGFHFGFGLFRDIGLFKGVRVVTIYSVIFVYGTKSFSRSLLRTFDRFMNYKFGQDTMGKGISIFLLFPDITNIIGLLRGNSYGIFYIKINITLTHRVFGAFMGTNVTR